jgi:hypothetical protein
MGSYFPKPMANGICVHQIALALKESEYEVHVICFDKKGDEKEDIFEGIFIHRVKTRLFFKLRYYAEDNIESLRGKLVYKLAMLLNKLKKIMYLPLYPMTSPVFIYRYYKLATNLHKNHKFSMVFSVYNPFEAVVAGMMLKRQFNKVKYVIYSLDTLTNDGGVKIIPSKWTEKKGWQWEKRIYQYADKVLNLKCHEDHYNKKRYSEFKNKMKIIDIPLLRPLDNNLNKQDSLFEKKYLHFIYTGALDLRSRNPTYLCKLFDIINSNNKYKLHFYSRGNCEDLIMDYQEKTEGHVVRHGYVSLEESVNAICNSEILISIGNNNSDMIPSKIFEYISTGKKIIHFYEREDDSCINYYEQYPASLLIYEKDDFVENIKKIITFIDNPHVDIEIGSLKNIFEKNTPQYTLKIIKDMLM